MKNKIKHDTSAADAADYLKEKNHAREYLRVMDEIDYEALYTDYPGQADKKLIALVGKVMDATFKLTQYIEKEYSLRSELRDPEFLDNKL